MGGLTQGWQQLWDTFAKRILVLFTTHCLKQLDFGCLTLFMILVKETTIMNEVIFNHTIVKMEREFKRRERCGHHQHLWFKTEDV